MRFLVAFEVKLANEKKEDLTLAYDWIAKSDDLQQPFSLCSMCKWMSPSASLQDQSLA